MNLFTIRRNLQCQSAGQRLLSVKLVELALISQHLFVLSVHVGRILVLRNFFLYLVVDRLFPEHSCTRAVLVELQGAVLRVVRPGLGLVDVTDLAEVDVRVLMVRVVKGHPLVRTQTAAIVWETTCKVAARVLYREVVIREAQRCGLEVRLLIPLRSGRPTAHQT